MIDREERLDERGKGYIIGLLQGIIMTGTILYIVGLPSPDYTRFHKPVTIQQKDTNSDGIDDLIVIGHKNYESMEVDGYVVFIGQKDGTYLELDDYYSQKDKDTSEKNTKEKDSIEEKVKQEYKKN